MAQKIVLYTLLFLLAACSSKEAGNSKKIVQDFDLVCRHFTELVSSPEFSNLSSERRAERIELELTRDLDGSSSAYIAWTAIRNGPPAERYSLFVESAASVGYQGWLCPAIEEHGHEVGSVYK